MEREKIEGEQSMNGCKIVSLCANTELERAGKVCEYRQGGDGRGNRCIHLKLGECTDFLAVSAQLNEAILNLNEANRKKHEGLK